MNNIPFVLFGTLFGIVLTKSEVISWFRIQQMFRFQEWHMYLVIGSAVAVGAVSMMIVKHLRVKTFGGEPLNYSGKEFHKGFIIGGVLFGIGWAITGACPGPIFAQIGAGEYPALFTLAGGIAGAWLHSAVRDKLPH